MRKLALLLTLLIAASAGAQAILVDNFVPVGSKNCMPGGRSLL